MLGGAEVRRLLDVEQFFARFGSLLVPSGLVQVVDLPEADVDAGERLADPVDVVLPRVGGLVFEDMDGRLLVRRLVQQALMSKRLIDTRGHPPWMAR